MDTTPTRASRTRATEMDVSDQENQGARVTQRIKKPPPITPRRFTKFFTPKPQSLAHEVQTSRAALRTISRASLNVRRAPATIDEQDDYWNAHEQSTSRKKRRYSSTSSPVPAAFLPSSQEIPQSSPIKCHDDLADRGYDTDDDYPSIESDTAEHDIPLGPKIRQYASFSTSKNILSARLSGRRQRHVAIPSTTWQNETAGFYSTPDDVNLDLSQRTPPMLPFSLGACKTNPIVAVGDEEGRVRLLDTSESARGSEGFCKTVLDFKPHDNAIMDLTFSGDDFYLASACGDQSCQLIDVRAQRTLYNLRAHAASVKRIQFQPMTGDKILASCGRDGAVHIWDTRCHAKVVKMSRQEKHALTEMSEHASFLAPVMTIRDAHTTVASSTRLSRGKGEGPRIKTNSVPSRDEFSITSLCFLGDSRSHLLATSSEVDSVVKLWDMRATYTTSSRSKNYPPMSLSQTQEPTSHERHRRFGLTSLALSTDGGRMFALCRDHTVYAYSTAHLVLGCPPEMSHNIAHQRRTAPRNRTQGETGLGPLYGLRHPNLRLATFWPRLQVRQCNETNTELLAVASTDECAILFPTDERYHTPATRQIPAKHDPVNGAHSKLQRHDSAPVSRPARPPVLSRTSTSFASLFTKTRDEQSEEGLPIYYHGTPLINGHSKEVTSLVWSSEGQLVSASDDYTVRCWRDTKARDGKDAVWLRREKGKVEKLGYGWADVGIEAWDDEEIEEA